MFQHILLFLYDYLIEIMLGTLCVSLALRWLAYKAALFDQIYFYTFSRELEKNLSVPHLKLADAKIEDFIEGLMQKIVEGLPVRSLRFSSSDKKRQVTGFGEKKGVLVDNYVNGRGTIIHGVRSEISSFKNQFPPNYKELTKRIMDKDDHWVSLFGFFQIDRIANFIDIMPRIFVVLGILGTFIGISFALPQIVKIDFTNLEGSAGILKEFVLGITFAMKTSIAGILYSIVMTFLNALFPISKLRNEITRKMEYSLEHLWLSLHTDKDLFPLMYRELCHIRSALSGKSSSPRKYLSKVSD